MLDPANPLDHIAATTVLRSTDLIATGAWLLPSPVLEVMNVPYSHTVMRMMWWSDELGLYVGESALLSLANGGDPSKHAFVYWEA